MDYDNDYLGVGNSQHPANVPEIDSEEEKDLTIREALETGHEDLLLESIGRQEKLLDFIDSELKMLIDYYSTLEDRKRVNSMIPNKMKALRKLINN